MEKVKLPKHIAEYIEDLLIDTPKDGFLAGVLGNANSPKYIAIREHFNNDFDTLLAALVLGWEPEQTPEDKVREIFNSVNGQINGDPYKDGYHRGIIQTLYALGKKIEGVNA